MSKCNVDVLYLHVAHQFVNRMFASDTTIFETAERRTLEALVPVTIDPHIPCFYCVRHAKTGRNIVGPDIRTQAVITVVYLFQHVCLIVPGKDAHYRAENFFTRYFHSVLDVVEDSDVEKITFL